MNGGRVITPPGLFNLDLMKFRILKLIARMWRDTKFKPNNVYDKVRRGKEQAL